jgi:hypothetical protein
MYANSKLKQSCLTNEAIVNNIDIKVNYLGFGHCNAAIQ